jgi:hypothetical protein
MLSGDSRSCMMGCLVSYQHRLCVFPRQRQGPSDQGAGALGRRRAFKAKSTACYAVRKRASVCRTNGTSLTPKVSSWRR